MLKIKIKAKASGIKHTVILIKGADAPLQNHLTDVEISYVQERIAAEETKVLINRYTEWFLIVKNASKATIKTSIIESYRAIGAEIYAFAEQKKVDQLAVVSLLDSTENTLAFTEGLLLTSYRFVKHKTKDVKPTSLEKVVVVADNISSDAIDELENLAEGVFLARDLVNEPQSHLDALQLADEFKKMSKEAGFEIEILHKKKIESLKMGGLLAVNKGSLTPPTFTIMEWKPENAQNKQPYLLVGKGVVYDTGGLSLKPTAGSMDEMKCDMAGAAAVGAFMYVAAKNKLPLHIVALVPATDNRPSQNAYAPGDIITMYNGMSVEVLNTDAEGRLILADALTYGEKFKPELVIDLATLTGSAVMTLGLLGIAAMGTAAPETMEEMKKAGFESYERVAELPFWDEYGDMIKTPIADIKNIGGKYAGCITAGKFLSHFVSAPWIHLDIAGPAFLDAPSAYRPKGGSGVGVRLLYQFFKNKVNEG